MNDPLAVALAALIVIVLLGGGLLAGAIWGLTRDRQHLEREDGYLHQRITDLGAYCQEIRDYVADTLGVNDDAEAHNLAAVVDVGVEQPAPAPGPATTPAAAAIDAGHEELVAREPGRHRHRQEHR